MALDLIPDVEDIVGDYLRTHPDVVAIGAKVVGTSLGTSTVPWVRVTCLDSPRRGPIDHLIEFYLQLDCFPGTGVAKNVGGQAQVNLLQRTVRAALMALPGASLSVFVTAVDVRHARLLDTTVEPAVPYVALTATVWLHK